MNIPAASLFFLILFAAVFFAGWSVRGHFAPPAPAAASSAHPVRRALRPQPAPRRSECGWCGLILKPGGDPVTTGICLDCAEDQRQQMRTATALRQQLETSAPAAA